MSKLYDALERLKENENGPSQAAAGPSRPPRSSRPRGFPWKWLLAALFTVALMGSTWWAWRTGRLPLLRGSSPVHTVEHRERAEAPARPAPSKGAASSRPLNVAALNHRAVELIKRGEYWPALALLRRGLEQAPERKELYYNTIVALFHLRLMGAAEYYYRVALQRFGKTPWVMRNQEVLAAGGVDVEGGS